MKIISVIVSTIFISFAAVNADDLLCYVCEGSQCDNLTDELLQSCGPENPISNESSTATPAIEPTTESTAEPTQTFAPTDDSSRMATTTQITNSTPTSTTQLVDKSDLTEKPSTPTQSTTEITDDHSYSTNSTTLPSESTSSSTNSTTQLSGDSSASFNLTTEPTEVASSSLRPTTQSSEETTQQSTTKKPRPTIQFIVDPSDKPTTSFATVPPPSSGSTVDLESEDMSLDDPLTFQEANNSPFMTRRSRRYISASSNYRYPVSRQSESDTYACYTIFEPSSAGSTQVRRGCVIIPSNQTGCAAVRDKLQVQASPEDKCQACLMNRCNDSTSLRISIVVVLFMVSIRFLI